MLTQRIRPREIQVGGEFLGPKNVYYTGCETTSIGPNPDRARVEIRTDRGGLAARLVHVFVTFLKKWLDTCCFFFSSQNGRFGD